MRTAIKLFVVLVSLPLAGMAQDRVVMINGDVITGNVSLISGDELLIEPSYADEFAIDLAEVASVEIQEAFDIELENDTKMQARLALDAFAQLHLLAPRTHEIGIADGAPNMETDGYIMMGGWTATLEF